MIGLVVGLGCSGGPMGAIDAFNAAPLAPYAERMVTSAGVALTVHECAMFSGTRAGYCLLTGDRASATAFQSQAGGERVAADKVLYGETCLRLEGFGRSVDSGWRGEPGTVGFWGPPAINLPSNTDNIKVDAIWVNRGRVCVQVQFPYG